MVLTKDMSTTPRSIRWAPQAERGTALYQSLEEANGNSSIKTESKSQLTLRRRRSFGDFLLHRKKPVINENKERCAETVKPRSWVSYQVKKLVTQLSPSRRRELRHMKSEGSISSLYNAHLEQPIQALSDSLQQPPSYAEINIRQWASEVKPKLDMEPVTRNVKANMSYMRRVRRRLEETPGTAQWQDIILERSRILRRERCGTSFVSAQSLDCILENSLPLRSQCVELAKDPSVTEFDLLYMPDQVVKGTLREAGLSPLSIDSGEFEISFFNTHDPIYIELLSLDLSCLSSDNSGINRQTGSKLTTPSVTPKCASKNNDEYNISEHVQNYIGNRPGSTKEPHKESPGVIVMDSLPYYAVDESSSSEDSLNAEKLDAYPHDSSFGADGQFSSSRNSSNKKRRFPNTGLRKISKKMSLVDFFQTQGILKSEPTLNSRSSAPTKRLKSSKHVDDYNFITDCENESKTCSIFRELMDYQELLERQSATSTEVDSEFGEPLERLQYRKCGEFTCDIRCGRYEEEDSNLQSMFGKPVAAYPRMATFTRQSNNDDAGL